MTAIKVNSNRGFTFGMLSIGFIVLIVLIVQFFDVNNSYYISLLIGLIVFLVGVLSIIGLIYSVKSIKEPNTAKKIIGLTINLTIVILFISIIITNLYDVYNAILA